VQHYGVAALLGIAATLVSVWLVGRLSLYGAPAAGKAVSVLPDTK
jgi:hypothetical protein